MATALSKARIEIGLLFILLVFIIPTRYMTYDMELWTDWALQIHRHGLTNVYNNPTVNYHPVFLYVIYLYDLIQGSEEYIRANITYLKLVPLVFDFLPIVVLCCFRQRLVQATIPYFYLLLNIAYLFNTLAWGQMDSIHTNLVFLALLVAFYAPVGSALLFALALGTKLQAIIFLPPLLLVWLYSIRGFRQVIGIVLGTAGMLVLVSLPFLLAGRFGQLWHVVTHAVGFYPNISVGAFNFWYLIMQRNPYHTMDYETFFIFSYKQWGMVLFFLASGLTLLPLAFRMWRLRLQKAANIDDTKQMLLLATGLITLYFFYFNTQMHERYAHPILIFFFFYGVYSKNYKLYILASIPYLLSLDKCFPDYLPIVHYKFIYASHIIAIWYTLTLAYSMYLFFKAYGIRREYAALKAGTNM